MTPLCDRSAVDAQTAMSREAAGPSRFLLRYGLGPSLLVAAAQALSAAAHGAHVTTVIQKDRNFSVSQVAIERGDTIRFTNEDGFLHQMFAHSVPFSFDSDEQKPGQDVDVDFPVAGRFQVLCGIHPKMRLEVDVK